MIGGYDRIPHYFICEILLFIAFWIILIIELMAELDDKNVDVWGFIS